MSATEASREPGRERNTAAEAFDRDTIEHELPGRFEGRLGLILGIPAFVVVVFAAWLWWRATADLDSIATRQLAGKTILPGYIDVHNHVYHRTSYGVHTSQEPRLMVDLAYGITTLRDPFGYGTDLMALGERAAVGDLMSPRIFSVSRAISAPPIGSSNN